MIRFFRKIRLNLLSEKKFTKYLLYALGEIILVVIGILIALAINTANQNRINKNYEHTYLLGLEQEFETSRMKLKELIAVNKSNANNSRKILQYITYKNETPTEVVFSNLLYNTFSNDIAFNPNNSLLNEMINSGNLKNLSNTELRRQLTNWLSTMEDISRQEKELSVQREKVLDMFRTDKSSLRTILEHTRVYNQIGLPKSENEISNLHLLNSKEFENNILMFIFTSYATERAHYLPTMQDLESILHLIRKEIKE
jgi:tellurite resistance protein